MAPINRTGPFNPVYSNRKTDPLSTLAKELLQEISSYLKIYDLSNLRLANRTLQEIVNPKYLASIGKVNQEFDRIFLKTLRPSLKQSPQLVQHLSEIIGQSGEERFFKSIESEGRSRLSLKKKIRTQIGLVSQKTRDPFLKLELVHHTMNTLVKLHCSSEALYVIDHPHQLFQLPPDHLNFQSFIPSIIDSLVEKGQYEKALEMMPRFFPESEASDLIFEAFICRPFIKQMGRDRLPLQEVLENIEKGIQLAQRIRSPIRKDGILIRISNWLTEKKQFKIDYLPMLRRLIEEMNQKDQTYRVISATVRALIESNHEEEASSLCEEFIARLSPEQKVSAHDKVLFEIVYPFIETGRYWKGQDMIGRMKDETAKNGVLMAICIDLIQSASSKPSNLQQALDYAQNISNPLLKNLLLFRIQEILKTVPFPKSDPIESRISIANLISDELLKSVALYTICADLIEQGDSKNGEKGALLIPRKTLRSSILTQINDPISKSDSLHRETGDGSMDRSLANERELLFFHQQIDSIRSFIKMLIEKTRDIQSFKNRDDLVQILEEIDLQSKKSSEDRKKLLVKIKEKSLHAIRTLSKEELQDIRASTPSNPPFLMENFFESALCRCAIREILLLEEEEETTNDQLYKGAIEAIKQRCYQEAGAVYQRIRNRRVIEQICNALLKPAQSNHLTPKERVRKIDEAIEYVQFHFHSEVRNLAMASIGVRLLKFPFMKSLCTQKAIEMIAQIPNEAGKEAMEKSHTYLLMNGLYFEALKCLGKTSTPSSFLEFGDELNDISPLAQEIHHFRLLPDDRMKKKLIEEELGPKIDRDQMEALLSWTSSIGEGKTSFERGSKRKTPPLSG